MFYGTLEMSFFPEKRIPSARNSRMRNICHFHISVSFFGSRLWRDLVVATPSDYEDRCTDGELTLSAFKGYNSLGDVGRISIFYLRRANPQRSKIIFFNGFCATSDRSKSPRYPNF